MLLDKELLEKLTVEEQEAMLSYLKWLLGEKLTRHEQSSEIREQR